MKFQMAILAALIPSIHGAVLFSDDFESPHVSGSYQTFSLNQSFNGWTVSKGNVDLVGSGFWASAGQVVDLNGTTAGGISRTISTTLGQKYSVEFDVRANDTSSKSVTFTFGVNPSFTFNNGLGADQTEFHITRYVEGSGSDLMKFTSNISGTSGGWMLNNLRISEVSASLPISEQETLVLATSTVPEPHEWAMISGAALVAFGAWRKRAMLRAA